MSEREQNVAPPDFSLTSGGLLYRFFVRARLTKPPMDLLRRRVVVLTLVAWLPLLGLSLWEGTAYGGVPVPFLRDVGVHVRLLIGLPMLLWAEYVVHLGIQPVIAQFLVRGIVPPDSEVAFRALVQSNARLRDSLLSEAIIFAVMLLLGHFVADRAGLHTTTWQGAYAESGSTVSLAGKWYNWISVPLFQFIMLRWLFRWGLWVRFLWRVTRLPLKLIPTHPDRAAGLSFLSRAVVAFAPVLIALSAILGGVLASKILYEGAQLPTFVFELIVAVVFLSLLGLGPLLVFIPVLAKVRRRGEFEYGALATHYIAAFDEKWNRPNPAAQDDFMGSADIQSLADLSNSYGIVDGMRMVPFDRNAIVLMLGCAIMPLAPLVLFIIPLDELLLKVLGLLF